MNAQTMAGVYMLIGFALWYGAFVWDEKKIEWWPLPTFVLLWPLIVIAGAL